MRFFSFSFSFSRLAKAEKGRRQLRLFVNTMKKKDNDNSHGLVLFQLFPHLVLLGQSETTLRKEQVVKHDGRESRRGRDRSRLLDDLALQSFGCSCC